MAAFTTPFTGLTLRRPSPHPSNAPRCRMGDAVAPAITVRDTKSDATSSVTIGWETVAPNVSDAIQVEATVALSVALRSRLNPAPTLPTKPSPPPGVSPVDFYFPKHTRNLAPVVSLVYDHSISVSYDIINPAVAGADANQPDSVAFWKQKSYKWSAPDATASATPELLSTELYEKYYPSNIRNLAPIITMKKPAGDWDPSAFLQVATEFVQLNLDIARQVAFDPQDEAPSAAGRTAIAKYFDQSRLHLAPEIVIDKRNPMVVFSLIEVPEPTELASQMLTPK